MIEKLNTENNEWSISKEAIFEIQDKALAEDGFHMAFKAKSDDESFRRNTWIVKKYKRLRRKPLKRWKRPVNHNHENACIAAIIVVSNLLSILI